MRRDGGDIENVVTQGSVDNLAQLAGARETCRAQFALVQDGLDWPQGLEFVARLPRSEIVESRDLPRLGLSLGNLPLDEELSQLESGRLDLGVLVMDEDADLIQRAVRDRGLAIVNLPMAEVMAHRLARVRTGRIDAGRYDALRVIPPMDKTVLRVDTLITEFTDALRSFRARVDKLAGEIDRRVAS